MGKTLKKLLSFAIVLVMVISMLPMQVFAAEDDGIVIIDESSEEEGTLTESEIAQIDESNLSADDNSIDSVDELVAFAAAVNGGATYVDETVTLNADLDLSGIEWTPIGNGSRSGSGYTGNAFKGTFNGGNHTITGLTISTTSGADAALGLFGVVDGGTVKNLKLTEVNIAVSASECAGAAIGVLTGGTADSITVSGSVSAKRGNGGIVGRMLVSGTISNCTNNAAMTATGGANLGGIVGAAYYTASGKAMYITNCTNNGTVTGAAGGVGGIVGLSSAIVSGCNNYGTVTGANASVGGIVGEQQNYGSISGCTNSANVTSTAGYGTGGIVGWLRYNGAAANYPLKGIISVTNNSNSGTITGGSDAGGIVGTAYNAATITGNTNTAASLTAPNFGAGIVANIQFTETPIQGTSADSVVIPQENVTVTGNNSSTAMENINAACKDEYGYDNSSGNQEGTTDGNKTIVAKIGDASYETFAEALTAAKALTGDVTVEIYDKVTLAEALSGSYDSIKFVGKDTDAEIYLDVQGYITATGKKVAFEDLTLSKAQGGFITNAGFMNVAFGIYDVTEVTYTDCTFANGAYAASGKVTYTGCTFYRSHDKYGLWAYGDVDATVDDCTFADYRGIKMYAEDKAKTTELTVKNTDFSAVTDKPAIVLTYGESVTLEGNTYSSTGVFELDLDGAPNGTAVTSTDAITCVNDNGACGVLVDGKIYTTVAQAAEVATSGSTVTLLHDSTETVELPAGATLDKNGFTADGVTIVDPNMLRVSYEYNSNTPGWGTTKFANYAGAYAYAVANNTKATIVIEKTNTLSGNTFDNNHKNYSKLAVVIKDGATMGNALSKWDMTYPVTVEPGGTLTCARPKTASVSNIHIKNTLTVGAEGASKKAVVDFLSDTYQDCDISIRYNGKVIVHNADFEVQDLDAQGTLTITNSDVYVDGAFASATFFATTITDSTMTVKGNQISGGLSDFAGGTSNQLGNVKLTNSTLTIEEGTTKVAANVTATNSDINVKDLTVNSGKTLKLNDGSELDAENLTLAGTAKITVDDAPIAAKIGGEIYATLEEAFAAAAEGETITLLSDATPTLTSQRAITKAAVIDLNGKTLTLTEDDLYFGTTTFKNGTIVVDPSVKASTAVFWMFAGQTLTFENVDIVATGVTGTYLIGINGGTGSAVNLTNSSIVIDNAATAGLSTVICDNGNGNSVVIDGCDIDVTNIEGRFYLGGASGSITVNNSDIDLNGVKEGFYIRANQTLAIQGNSTVDITLNDNNGRYGINLTAASATYNVADTATVNATVDMPLYGSGTEADPIKINNLSDLKKFRDEVNAGKTYDNQFVKLTADIDLGAAHAATTWEPIGNGTNKFLGTFDGGNHTISNLVVDVDTNHAGLFGFASVVKNLTINNATVSGVVCVGALVGELESSVGTVDNCHVTGTIQITGENSVGGLVGKGYANIKNSSVIGDGAATSYVLGAANGNEEGDNVGGIIGHLGEGNTLGVNNVTVKNITVKGTRKVGGVLGTTARGNDIIGCTVDNVTVECTATAEYADDNASTTTIGGVVGNYFGSATTGGILQNCSVSNVTFVAGNAKSAGALVGGDRNNNGGAPVGVDTVSGNSITNVSGATTYHFVAAEVNGKYYMDLQEAIVAAAPSGTVKLLSDVTVDKWIMFAETMNISNGNIITLNINGLTIDGNGYALTVKSIESAGNGNRLFYDAQNLNINDLTINYVDSAAAQGGIGLVSGTIKNVTFNGGGYGVFPGAGNVTIEGCTFKTGSTAIYYEEARDNLVVTGNTFELADTTNVILLRGATQFTNNTVKSGRTVNVVSGSPVVTGNDFGDVRLKVYNVATATISENKINNLVFNDATATQATFTGNTLSAEAQAALAAVMPVAKIGTKGYTTVEAAVAALADGDTLTIYAGTYDAALNINKSNVTVIGEGDVTLNGVPSIKGTNYKVENIDFVYTTGRTNLGGSGLIKDCSFTATASDGNTFRYCYGTENAAITFEGCKLTAPMWAIHFDSAPGMDLTLTDCEINGRVALGGDLGSLTASDTTFENGYVNVWGTATDKAATFTGCDFVNVPYVFTGYDADNVVKFNSCKINGEAITDVNGLIWNGLEKAGGEIYVDDVLVNSAAKIGDVPYVTLQDAIDAANAGDTITLQKSIELTEGVTVPAGKTVTLDLAGKIISQTKAQTAGYQMILNDGNLTIEDSSAEGTGKISYTDSGNGGEYISDTIYNRGTLVINGGTIENLSSATVASNGYPHAVDNYSGIRDTALTVNGGTIYCAEYSAIRMFCVSATNKADLVITGGTIKGAVDMQNGTKVAANGSLNITGGTFETTKNANNIRFANWNGGATEYGITASISGGDFNGKITTQYVPAAANWNKQIISGGTYTDGSVEAYLADGYELKYSGGKFSVVASVVAIVGGTTYTDLQAAINAANGKTVYLQRNAKVSAPVEIPEGAVITLDLQNYTLTGSILAPNAQLTVQNGSIVNPDSSVSALEINAGKLALTNVNMDSARHAVRIDGAVEATIDGGKYRGAIGTGKGTYYAVNVSGAANVTIVDGTFVGPKGTTADSGAAVNAQTGATVTIEGGDFSGGKLNTLTAKGTLTVIGGTYDQDPSAYVAKGYCAVNNNGVYGIVEAIAFVGEVGYPTVAAALTAAQDGETITLVWAEGDAPIAMNGAVYGKTVTITGTATVDWSKGFLFVGRGGEGNGTVIFDNANLTSASNSASYGIHVSGREKNTNNKYDGTLVINNSTIELDYLINKGAMTLDNSTLTVKNGFSIGGRPASETESGVDATATLNLTNGSKVVVNNHNGMGLGYEAIGVMNVDETSTFETTKSFLVTAKGTMNLAGTATIAGTLTNNGSIVLTSKDAKLNSSESGNVTTDVADYNVAYEDGIYKLVEKVYVAQVGQTKYESLTEAMAAAQAGDTVTIFEGTYALPAMKAGITVEGVGNVLLEGTLSGTLEDLTLKNLHIKGGNAQRWAYAKGDLVFENVTFEATSVYALHFDGISEGATLLYKDCTIIGWAAMSGSPASCVFDGCTIKDNGTYGVIRTYFDATIQDCTFNVANANTNDVYQDGIHAVSGAEVTVDGCTNANGEMIDLVNVGGTSVVVLDGEEIRNVAKVGDTYYRDLRTALVACQAGETVTLLTDVDLAGAEWEPVGTSSEPFKGIFDGNGKTISNLVINGGSKSNQGLFGMTTNGEIKNLTINNAKVSGRLNVGVLAGTPYTSKYTNITITGDVIVEGMSYVGGVGGKNAYADWTNITVNVNEGSYVKATSTENGVAYRTYVGGVVGFMGEGGHTFSNITSNIDVIGDVCDIGGIVGIAHYGNNFVDVSCSGDVTNTNDNAEDVLETGGIAGVWHNGGSAVTFENLTYTGTVSTPNADVELLNGGVIGAAYGTSGAGKIDGSVAIVNGKTYATLAAALAAVQEGQTVYLLSATISEGTVKMPAQLKNVTIQGTAGTVLKDTTLMAHDGNTLSYVGLTIDGVAFDNSRISITGWRTGAVTVEDLTITNCEFKNLNDTTNSAPVHINMDADEAVKNFTFSNNVIDGATGGSKSGVYAQLTGEITFTDNVINNVSFRPYVIQITTDDGIADNFVVTGNTFSGSAAGRAQGLGNNSAGTDTVNLVVSGNIFKDITSAQQICYWNFNEETTTADLSKNYYDIDVAANANRFYYNSAAADAEDLIDMGIYPYYADEAMTTLVNAPAIMVTYADGTIAYFDDILEAVPFKTNYDKVEGATIKLLGDYTGSGIRFVENDMVLDLNGHTYTINEGTGSNTTRTQAFQVRATANKVTVKNGTIAIAPAAEMNETWGKIAYMFNVYSPELILENVTMDMANMTWSYGESVYAIVFQSGSDSVKMTGTTSIENFDAAVGGSPIYLAAGKTLTGPEGLDVEVPNGYELSYANGVYSTVKQIAQVGENYYTSVQAAIDAAQAGETVTILDNIVLTSTVVVAADDEIVLELNGKTISMEDASGTTVAMLKNNGNLTIQDSVGGGKLSFNSTTPSATNAYASNTISNYGTVTIESGIIENTSAGSACYALDNYAGSTATINGGELVAKKTTVRVFSWTNGTNTVLNVNGGSILSEDGYGINFNMGNAPVVELNITGGTITTNDTDYNLAVYVATQGSAENVTINVTDGTFNGYFALNGKTSETIAADAVSISGGEFAGVICYGTPAYGFVSGGVYADGTVEDYLADGYELDYANGKFTVVAVPVASVAGEEYTDLQAAIEAAEATGEAVYLKRDIVLKAPITVNGTVVLNLKGYTISQEKACTESYSMITNNGNLTITGDGKISFTDTGAGDPNFGWGSYTIVNRGTLVVENGTIEHLGAQNAPGNVVHMICAIQQAAGSTTINGGTISTPNYRSIRVNKGELIINGGNMVGQVWLQPNQGDATLTITGGTFAPAGGDASAVFMTNVGEKYTVTAASITGGTFNGKIGCSKASALAGIITGGLFTETAKNNTVADLLGENMVFSGEANAEGYYAVVERSASGEVAYRAYVNDSADREAVQVDLSNVYAKESLVVKLYDANGNLLTTTTYKNGGVDAAEFTVNIVLDGRASSSWDTVIETTLSKDNVPATIELIADGTVVDTYENALGAGTNVDETAKYLALDVLKSPVAFSGMTMTLKNSLAVSFVLDIDQLEGETGHYAVINKKYADGREDVTTKVNQADWTAYTQGSNLYMITFNGVSAKEMCDEFSVVIYNAAGEAVTDVYTRSIHQYAMNQIDKYMADPTSAESQRWLPVYVDMLNYGAEAQNTFEYAMGNLANKDLTADHQAYATGEVEVTSEQVKGEGNLGTAVTLRDRMQLGFAFSKSFITDGMYAVATFTNYRGEAVSQTIEASEFMDYGSDMVLIPVTATVIADCKQLVTLTVYDASGNVVSVSADSVAGYAARNDNAITDAIMKFSESAKKAFQG